MPVEVPAWNAGAADGSAECDVGAGAFGEGATGAACGLRAVENSRSTGAGDGEGAAGAEYGEGATGAAGGEGTAGAEYSQGSAGACDGEGAPAAARSGVG